MKYGHFSEQEINQIVLILERNNISYQVSDDPEAIQGINDSMKNNLRHYHGATICNDILMIEFEDAAWEKFTDEDKKSLADLRILSPDELENAIVEFKDELDLNTEPKIDANFQNKRTQGNNFALGITFIIVNLIGIIIYLTYKN